MHIGPNVELARDIVELLQALKPDDAKGFQNIADQLRLWQVDLHLLPGGYPAGDPPRVRIEYGLAQTLQTMENGPQGAWYDRQNITFHINVLTAEAGPRPSHPEAEKKPDLPAMRPYSYPWQREPGMMPAITGADIAGRLSMDSAWMVTSWDAYQPNSDHATSCSVAQRCSWTASTVRPMLTERSK
ncbi:hypothetical protein [Streptomyces violascens]|uniref:hypothetical protein n=1 Tax=Streptomyces violascens TaxID=67381 RepID=UPI00167917FC|nr:hypothetical protein [Streptomyces violascens]